MRLALHNHPSRLPPSISPPRVFQARILLPYHASHAPSLAPTVRRSDAFALLNPYHQSLHHIPEARGLARFRDIAGIWAAQRAARIFGRNYLRKSTIPEGTNEKQTKTS